MFEDITLSVLVLTGIVLMLCFAFLLGRRSAQYREEECEDSLEPVTPPSPEQLQQLKQALNLQKGSVVFKKGSIYHIVYQDKKHVWNRLGSWLALSQQLDEVTTSGATQPASLCFHASQGGYVGVLRREWKKLKEYPLGCYPSVENPNGCALFLQCVGVAKQSRRTTLKLLRTSWSSLRNSQP